MRNGVEPPPAWKLWVCANCVKPNASANAIVIVRAAVTARELVRKRELRECWLWRVGSTSQLSADGNCLPVMRNWKLGRRDRRSCFLAHSTKWVWGKGRVSSPSDTQQEFTPTTAGSSVTYRTSGRDKQRKGYCSCPLRIDGLWQMKMAGHKISKAPFSCDARPSPSVGSSDTNTCLAFGRDIALLNPRARRLIQAGFVWMGIAEE